jgi:2-phospho-L-lactate guanylyltransferase
MSLWVIIPVKPLGRAKSRLSDVLTPDERRDLAERFLRRVLMVVRAVPQVAGALVISRDSKALSIAREYGAHTVQESGAPELNNALMRATQVVASWKGGGVLILPADLPLLAPEDIATIADMGRLSLSVVIAPDQNEDGTNAMLIRPPGLIPYMYGPSSFHRHKTAATEAGADVKIYRSHRVELDIDLPEDLTMYNDLVRDNDDSPFPIITPGSAS